MLELAVEECGVLDHLIEDAAPTKPNLEWCTIDLILKRWIDGSISHELTGMIIDPIKMVRQLYVALSAVFLTNKRTSTVHLTSDLHKQRQGSLDISQYFARIKTIPNALHDVNQLASDDPLVSVLTRGLHERPHVTGKILPSYSGMLSLTTT
jgi:hypothetical protein